MPPYFPFSWSSCFPSLPKLWLSPDSSILGPTKLGVNYSGTLPPTYFHIRGGLKLRIPRMVGEKKEVKMAFIKLSGGLKKCPPPLVSVETWKNLRCFCWKIWYSATKSTYEAHLPHLHNLSLWFQVVLQSLLGTVYQSESWRNQM